MTFPLKPNIFLSNLIVAERMQHTVSLNVHAMPPNQGMIQQRGISLVFVKETIWMIGIMLWKGA